MCVACFFWRQVRKRDKQQNVRGARDHQLHGVRTCERIRPGFVCVRLCLSVELS